MRAGFEQHDTDYKTASPVIYISYKHISQQLLLFCLSSGCFKLQSQVFKASAGLTIVSYRQVNPEVKHESNSLKMC